MLSGLSKTRLDRETNPIRRFLADHPQNGITWIVTSGVMRRQGY